LRLAPVAGEEAADTRITYRGSEKTDYREGVCRLVAPIGDDRTLLVEAGIDLTGVRWYYQKAVEEPCAYMAYKHGYPEMLAKLRS
jgi:hypothetical protein